jgi:metal-responsive CopG/Arc/MetJ family transcriptional regulator
MAKPILVASIDLNVYLKLEEHCKKNKRTKSEVVEEALKKYLDIK